MRPRAVLVLALLGIGLLRHEAEAQSILDFDDWMEDIDHRTQSVQRNLTSRDAVAATADAKQIAELYSSMEAFFNGRGVAGDALKLSREGQDQAAVIIQAVSRNDFAAGTQAALVIARACRGCHLQYKPLE